MDGNQQQNPQVNPESPNITNQSATTPGGQQTPAQFMDIPEHQKTSPAKKILKISFIFLSLSALIIAGYYLYTLLTKEKPQTPSQIVTEEHQSSPTPTLSPEPTVTDPTADWKIYRNEKADLEFKYPKDWHLKEYPKYRLNVWLNKYPIPEGDVGGPISPLSIIVNECINTNTNEVYSCETDFDTAIADNKRGFNETTISINKNFAISGKTGVQISGLLGPGPSEGNYAKVTLFPYGEYQLSIGLYLKEYETIYDQILSTFRFL